MKSVLRGFIFRSLIFIWFLLFVGFVITAMVVQPNLVQGAGSAGSKDFVELALNKKMARCLGGKVEVPYTYPDGKIYVDIETRAYVIETGLDQRASLDSVQQVSFASMLSGKKPKIIIFDRDRKKGKYEYRIEKVAKKLSIDYMQVSVDLLNMGDCP